MEQTTGGISLDQLVTSIADALAEVDNAKRPYREFQPGVGPYGEPQLVKLIAASLSRRLRTSAVTKRTPDLLIPQHWAVEFKIARPYGDNGKEAENWSVNLLHPYPGNVSTIGDCYKLANWNGPERRAAVVIGYEHTPARVDLEPLIRSFEVVAREVARVKISNRVEVSRAGLIHPVDQCVKVFAWEVFEHS